MTARPLVLTLDRGIARTGTGGGLSNTASKLLRSFFILPAQVIPPAALTQIVFQSTPVDSLKAADLPNNRLVIPDDGLYLVIANVQFAGLAASVSSSLSVIRNVLAPENIIMTASVGPVADAAAFGESEITNLLKGDALTALVAQTNLGGADRDLIGASLSAVRLS